RFWTMLPGAFVPENSDTQVPNLIVDLMELGFRKFVRRRKFVFETRNAAQRAVNLIRRQRAQNSMHVFDFRNAMADHGEVISRSNPQANRVFEFVPGENSDHITLVGHNKTFASELLCDQNYTNQT